MYVSHDVVLLWLKIKLRSRQFSVFNALKAAVELTYIVIVELTYIVIVELVQNQVFSNL